MRQTKRHTFRHPSFMSELNVHGRAHDDIIYIAKIIKIIPSGNR